MIFRPSCPSLAKGGSLTHSQALALSKRARDVTALRCSEPLRYKVGGPSKVCAMLCGMGSPWDRGLKVEVWGTSLGVFGAIGADVIIGYPIFPSFLLL